MSTRAQGALSQFGLLLYMFVSMNKDVEFQGEDIKVINCYYQLVSVISIHGPIVWTEVYQDHSALYGLALAMLLPWCI